MTPLIELVLDSVVFFFAFRALTLPAPKASAHLRVALTAALVFVVALGNIWQDCSPWSLLACSGAVAVGSAAGRDSDLLECTNALGRLRFPLFLLAMATVSAAICLFVPITILSTLPGELSINLDHLATVNAQDAIMVVGVAVALYAISTSSRTRTVLTLLASGAAVIVVLYAYLLPFGYPAISGLAFEQVPVSPGAIAVGSITDLAVIAIVAVVLRAALLRFGARAIIASVLLVDASLAGAGMWKAFRDTHGVAADEERLTHSLRALGFSPTHPNVLIIFLDRFMGSYIESIIDSDPALAERLSGFTWYPRTVSAGENSVAGMHALLGGYDYLPVEMNARGKPLRDLSVEAFSILPYNFARKGYRVNMVSPLGMGFTLSGDCKFLQMKNVTCTHLPLDVVERKARKLNFPIKALSKADYADLLVPLASLHSAPFAVKRALLERGSWPPLLDHSAGTTFREWAQLTSLAALTETNEAESTFNFVSNSLPHEPYYMGEDCVPRREVFAVSDEEAARRGHISLFSLQHAIAARCALLEVANYLDFLKREGVYDNTRIVIASDHGIVGPVEDHSTRAEAGGTQDDEYLRLRPLMLVKSIGATGPLKVSEEFMPNAETPRIVCEDIGGCVNPFLGNRPIEAAGRDDPFYVSIVPWQFNLQKPDAFVIWQQLALKGKDPFDAHGWVHLPKPGTGQLASRND